MNSDTAIKIDNLSKVYRIGAMKKPYGSLREEVHEFFSSRIRRMTGAGLLSDAQNTIWALKDVSLDIKHGEVLGIIGRNGSGKSTLLKILSRITEPTKGRVEIHGRVGSLLEVGTGFHPELTGRENIFLNGAILGMTREEIKNKFDEIVEFSGVEKMIDTSVKFYSSGMYVRLAFAVAAHLEPDILLVDEVLAVGDAVFQKKCLGKMEEVTRQGRTVLFVSHNMAAIASLCKKTIVLDKGTLLVADETTKAIEKYQNEAIMQQAIPISERNDRNGDGSARIVSLQIESADSDKIIRSDSPLRVRIKYKSSRPIQYPHFVLSLRDYTAVGIYLLDSEMAGGLSESLPAEGTVECVTAPLYLTPGRCYFNIALHQRGVMSDGIQSVASIDIETSDVYGTGKIPPREWVMGVLKQKWALIEE